MMEHYTAHDMATADADGYRAAGAGWQPIETAPKSTAEGRRVTGIYLLGFIPDPDGEQDDPAANISVIWYEPRLPNKTGGCGLWTYDGLVEVHPTHWMPLPAAPGGDDDQRWAAHERAMSLADDYADSIVTFTGDRCGSKREYAFPGDLEGTGRDAIEHLVFRGLATVRVDGDKHIVSLQEQQQ